MLLLYVQWFQAPGLKVRLADSSVCTDMCHAVHGEALDLILHVAQQSLDGEKCREVVCYMPWPSCADLCFVVDSVQADAGGLKATATSWSTTIYQTVSILLQAD